MRDAIAPKIVGLPEPLPRTLTRLQDMDMDAHTRDKASTDVTENSLTNFHCE